MFPFLSNLILLSVFLKYTYSGRPIQLKGDWEKYSNISSDSINFTDYKIFLKSIISSSASLNKIGKTCNKMPSTAIIV